MNKRKHNWTRVSLVSLVMGCGPGQGQAPPSSSAQEFGMAVCPSRTSCDCADDRFETTPLCEAHWSALFADAEASGSLELDPACLDALVSSEMLTECETWPSESFDWDCPVLQGTKAEGDACTNHFDLFPALARECVEGLSCIKGQCRLEPLPPVLSEPGDPCRQDDFVPCTNMLYCSANANNACMPFSAPGSPCSEHLQCGVDHYCEGLGATGEGSCAPTQVLGSPCDPLDWRSCGIDGWCDGSLGRCTPDTPGTCYLTHPLTFGSHN